MKLSAVALFGVFAVGCGGGDDAPAFVGKWLYVADNGCAVGIQFDADGTFVDQILCISGTTAQDQAATGRYTVEGDQITLIVEKASCTLADDPTAFDSDSFKYTLSDGNLILSDGESVLSLDRNDAKTSDGAIIAFGCFLDDGTFRKSPLASK